MHIPKHFFTFIFIFTFPFIGKSQNIHYYGWDLLLSHSPTDIIQTQDGGFLITGDVFSSAPILENYVSRNYLVHTDSTGDTLWTKYYFHDAYGNEGIIQDGFGNFHSLGQTSGGYLCGLIGSGVPFTDYCVQNYLVNGDSLSFSPSGDNCWDDIYDISQNQSGGLSALIMQRDVNANRLYGIKEMNSSGSVSTIMLPNNYVSDMESAANGYWMANFNTLTKISFAGNIMWQNGANFSPDLPDFCRVNNDSLVFICGYTSGPPPDTTSVIKTDSSGNVAWIKTFHLKASDVMLNSNGYYVLTGRSGDSLAVLALSSNGDSIWGKKYGLAMPAYGIKTIDASGGRIATLAYAGGIGLPGQYALIFDTIGSVTGIEEMDGAAGITISPQPAGEFIFVRGADFTSSKKYRLEIFSSLGSKLESIPISNDSGISIKGLPAGLYFYNFTCNEKILKRGKIIVSR